MILWPKRQIVYYFVILILIIIRKEIMRMLKPYLSIGEISRLFGLSVQTLRYYDKIDLFVPDYRDDNNYRKYRFEQCYHLAAICYMRRLGYSLARIAYVMESRSVHGEKELKKRIQEVHQEQYKLAEIERAMGRKLLFLNQELSHSKEYNRPAIISFSKRYFLPIGDEEILYRNESFYLNPTIVFYDKKANRQFGAYLVDYSLEKDTSDEYSNVSYLPAGDYLCAYFQGFYSGIWSFVCALRKEYANLSLANWSVHFNIVDQFIEKDSNEFLTHVQIFLRQDNVSGNLS